MKALKIMISLVTGIVVVIILILFLVGYFKSPKAGLLIDANKTSLIFINGEQVGKTKYEGTYTAGEAAIKLVPESFDKPIAPYEVKVDLTPGVRTIIQRDFGDSEEVSGGAIISFEKGSVGDIGIAVVSIPDTAQVMIDGQVRGSTPFKLDQVSEGEHSITVTLPGYSDKSVNVRTYRDYKLTAVFTLVKNGEVAGVLTSPSPTPLNIEQYGVKILDTPTGFLRVRSEPSALAKEVGQVEPGKLYKYVEEDPVSGWLKIVYGEDTNGESLVGWISNEFAKKTLETPTPKPSPSASVKPSGSPLGSPKPSVSPKP